MEKECQGLEEGPKAKIHFDSLRATLINYQIGKRQNMMVYMDSGLINSLPSMTEWISKRRDAEKKQTYPNGWSKERPPK